MKIKISLAGWFLMAILPLLPAQTFTVLHDFTNSPDGARPRSLILNGNVFYGVTTSGGNSGNGLLFQIPTAGGNVTPVYSFDGAANGASPNEILLNGSTIFGTTQTAGDDNFGTIYSVNANGGGYSLMHTFTNQPDGQTPKSGLVLAGTTLYGVTAYGGTNGVGSIYKINTDGGGYAQLRSFTSGFDGNNPFGSLVLGGSTLYGTTAYGGTNGFGTIFKININGGGYTILYSFSNSPDAQYPYSGLVISNNVLYGTASYGGGHNAGAIFSIGTNGGGYTLLHVFTNNPDGSSPQSTLVLTNGMLYGTTVAGGSGNFGTVFRLNLSNTNFQVLKNFANDIQGGNPQSTPVVASNLIWATALIGGTVHNGTLFSLQLSPTITAQPQSLTVTNEDPATFSVTVTDDSTIQYQWYFNTNTILSGQTNSTLTYANATNNNAGTYAVVVSDNFGAVTSSPAMLTVVARTATSPPSIVSQPQNVTVTNGSPASFTNMATGTPPLFYQWYFNTNTAVAGATNAIFTIASTTNNQAGYYSVIVTNSYGYATSSPALLTLIIPQTFPVIIQQPQNVTVTNGSPASFTNAATGTPPLFYQWYFNTNTVIAGATNAIFAIASTTNNQAGYYSVIVTNSYGSATSSPALLTLIIPPTRPVIIQQPQNVTVTNGYPANFTNISSGSGLLYQWYYNNTANPALLGDPVAGETNNILSLIASFSNNGYYSVIVSNNAGAVTSSPALLTVLAASTAPVITVQPQPLSVVSGDIGNFAVGVSGRAPLAYQWYFNSNTTKSNLLGSKLTGQTGSSLSITSSIASIGYYSVVVTNRLGNATSTPALLTVITNPVITLQPQSTTNNSGDSVTFTAAAIGADVLHYQWFFQTNTPVAGGTNSTLNLINITNSVAGSYMLVVTNIYGRATSSVAILTILSAPIHSQPYLVNFQFNPANGSFSFTLSNAVNSVNYLLVTTNLTPPVSWRPIATNTMAPGGLWFYTDANAATIDAQRFYRFSSP